jgi:hypothetical protein
MNRRIYLCSISFLFLFLLFSIPIRDSAVAEQISSKTASSVLAIDSVLQTATISVSPATVTSQVGYNFIINITISDVTDLYGWEYKLKWNNTLLDATNSTEGPFLKSGGDTFFSAKINNTAGSMLVDCTLLGNVPGVSGNGTLASVTFFVKNSGECPLDLYNTTLINSLEQAILHQTIDGYGYFSSSEPPPPSPPPGPPPSRRFSCGPSRPSLLR